MDEQQYCKDVQEGLEAGLKESTFEDFGGQEMTPEMRQALNDLIEQTARSFGRKLYKLLASHKVKIVG